MAREDVVHVLHRFTGALASGGVILDLQAIAPEPVVDAAIARGELREEAADDHDVLRQFPTGESVVEHYRPRARSVPESALPLLRANARPHVVRERCRLRRLRRTS